MTMKHDLHSIRTLDLQDPLRDLRAKFRLPEGMVYLDGNSLGAVPVTTVERMRTLIEDQWGRSVIQGWRIHDWMGAPQRIGAMIAPLIGARPNEVVAGDSTSVNLFKLIVAALGAANERSTILSEPGNFPTDLYIADGVTTAVRGSKVRIVPAEEIIEAIDDDVAVVLLTHVHYKTGRKHDMHAITKAAHDKGAFVIWDLSHSAGAVAVDLNGCNADMAVGCGYKYLNGGPGAPAWLFVAERLHQHLRSPLSGWIGHASPYEFRDDYVPAATVSRFLCGTPPVVGLMALEEGARQFDGIDFDELLAKSQALCSLYIDLMEQRCGEFGFELVTPRDSAVRGSHVSFAHPDASVICNTLIERAVVGDFRAPDVLRMGFTPLYTRYEDVWRAVETIEQVMSERTFARAG